MEELKMKFNELRERAVSVPTVPVAELVWAILSIVSLAVLLRCLAC
jgi:hypothetical protein